MENTPVIGYMLSTTRKRFIKSFLRLKLEKLITSAAIMKKRITAAMSLIVMLMQNSSAYDLVIGTNHFDVVFENVSTPSSLKDFIVEDVQRCYEAWGTNVVIQPNLPVRNGSYLRANVFMGPYYMENLYAEDLNVPEDIVTNTTGQLALKIPSILIQRYAEGFVFKTNHLAQVQAADAFVDFVTSATFANIPSNQVSNYFMVKDATPQTYLDSSETIIQGLTSSDFFAPSILGFTYNDRGPDATNLWVLIPVISKARTTQSSFDVFPAIWHDGRWKLSFWDATE